MEQYLLQNSLLELLGDLRGAFSIENSIGDGSEHARAPRAVVFDVLGSDQEQSQKNPDSLRAESGHYEVAAETNWSGTI